MRYKPPYWGLRDYGVADQIGNESTPEEYIEKLVSIFREVRRVLKSDGTLWLNLGDCYAGSGKGRKSDGSSGHLGSKKQSTNKGTTEGRLFKVKNLKGLKAKDLVGIPWRVAFALQKDGWYLRQDIIWNKPNVMPESVRDRCTKAHEYIFLFSKKPKYYFDYAAIREPAISAGERRGGGRKYSTNSFLANRKDAQNLNKYGVTPELRNKRSVWSVSVSSFRGAHFATFPPALIEPCILAGSKPGGTILDPFFGAGTTGLVAKNLNRNFIGIELNEKYIQIAQERLK